MTAHNELDRQLNDFLRDGPDELPYESFSAVRDRTEVTRQRVVTGPWRFPEMNKMLTIGLGAAAVVVLVLVGIQVFGLGAGGTGSAPMESAEPTATGEPTARAEASQSSAPATAPPLTGAYTSAVHGISLSYPEGWTARAATEPWTDRAGEAQYLHPGFDVLKDPAHDGELFLWITSRPIGDSTLEDWLAATMAEWGCTTTEPIDVDGATGLIGASGCHELAAVASDGRGYEVGLYHFSSGERRPDPLYDRAWFEEVLATVQLHPEDAD